MCCANKARRSHGKQRCSPHEVSQVKTHLDYQLEDLGGLGERSPRPLEKFMATIMIGISLSMRVMN
jgi:hypothetical protein